MYSTMTKVFRLLVFALLPISVTAQINESDTLDVKANLSVTGFWQAGNVETLIFRARQDFSARFLKNFVYKTQNSYVYQEFGRAKADEDILSLNFLYLNPKKRIYPLALGFFSTNFRREIEHRYLIGLGASFTILQEDDYWLKFSVTTEYEETEFRRTTFNRAAYNGISTIDTFRGTLWVNGRYQLLDGRLILGHESYYQPSLEEANNYRWQANLNVEVPISRYVNLTANYIQTFESIVIAGQKEEDRFLTFGFTVKTY